MSVHIQMDVETVRNILNMVQGRRDGWINANGEVESTNPFIIGRVDGYNAVESDLLRIIESNGKVVIVP